MQVVSLLIKFLQRHMFSIWLWMTRLIIINSKAFLPKAGAMLDALLDYITPWTRTIMATRGIAFSTPGISSFSTNGNSFSIKSILNLSDEAAEQLKSISKDGAPINVFDPQCSTPPLLVAPRAMFPPGYHRPLLSSSLPVGFFSLPPSRSAAQINPFNFPAHVCSLGK